MKNINPESGSSVFFKGHCLSTALHPPKMTAIFMVCDYLYVYTCV